MIVILGDRLTVSPSDAVSPSVSVPPDDSAPPDVSSNLHHRINGIQLAH